MTVPIIKDSNRYKERVERREHSFQGDREGAFPDKDSIHEINEGKDSIKT
jgi:hypothetical protein